MKKIFIFIILSVSLSFLVGCQKTEKDLFVIKEEQKRSFDYFWQTANLNAASAGYSLARDRYPNNPSLSSIAAVGFSLASIPVGVENGWISYEDGLFRATNILTTVKNLETINGFFYHFINIKTGLRSPGSEISIIDTGLLIAGAIVAGQYFQGEILEMAYDIYSAVNWPFYVNQQIKMFYMGYMPETGFSGAWDHVSEQLILYVLSSGAPSPTYRLDDSLYKRIKQVSIANYTGTYKSSTNDALSVTEPFIYTYNGSLFQYLFSHAFIDFRNIVDADNTNWFNNSKLAIKASYAYVQDQAHKYQTYGLNSWGLSAGDGPTGYHAFGGAPAKNNFHNGTITPYAAISSIVFHEDLAIKAANYFYTIDNLFADFGFKDSFNLGPVDANNNMSVVDSAPYVAKDYIGIDKGITVLMIENYFSGLIWQYFMQDVYIQEGIRNLGFVNT